MDDHSQSLSIQIHSEYYDRTESSNSSAPEVLGLWQDSFGEDSLPRMHSSSIGLSGLVARQAPKVLAIQLSHPLPKAIGFSFPESPHWTIKWPEPTQPGKVADSKADLKNDAEDKQDDAAEEASDVPKNPSGKKTRLSPPRNLIRLEDRLYYVLQPPLESIVQNAKLTFPFQPFPYQMDGIAFLYSRSSAILADEMGLGKTMQAITAIRMLLLSGEIRNALLVCPKPLVTNWMREFRSGLQRYLSR